MRYQIHGILHFLNLEHEGAMANTTQMLLTHFDEGDVIDIINRECNIDFRESVPIQPHEREKWLSLTSDGFCVRCLSEDAIEHVIEVFTNAPWQYPEYVTLVIIDDNSGQFNGVHVIPTTYQLTNLGE